MPMAFLDVVLDLAYLISTCLVRTRLFGNRNKKGKLKAVDRLMQRGRS